MQRIKCFNPVADAHSRVLVLGSMPGAESLRKGEYYGYKRNAFWPLMCTLLGKPYTENYHAQLDMLLERGIALWDVILSCERQGSLDARIKNANVNDFEAFFAAHPRITHVFFNGSKAHAMFARHVGFEFAHITFIKLGSTSPAHAIPFEQRIEDWRRILAHIGQ